MSKNGPAIYFAKFFRVFCFIFQYFACICVSVQSEHGHNRQVAHDIVKDPVEDVDPSRNRGFVVLGAVVQEHIGGNALADLSSAKKKENTDKQTSTTTN